MSTPARPGYRLIPCPGSAHDKEFGGMIDTCARCAPRWGAVERLTRAAIADLAVGRRHGGRSTTRELARALDNVLCILWGDGDGDERREWGADTLGELGAVLADYGPDVPTVQP